MGEEGGAGDGADFAGAGGDVLECSPALVEQGDPSFAHAAQGALGGVAGAVIDVQFPVAGGCLAGIRMPMPAPSYPVSASVGRSCAAAR